MTATQTYRPPAHADADELETAKSSRHVPEQPARILICDDEHLVAAGLANHLTELGFQVIGPARDGDSAIELCRTQKPDLALMDVRMPGRDGLSAADLLYHELKVPVIIVSAYSTPEYAAGGARAGVFGYLLKPVTLDQLRVGISVAWGRFVDSLAQDGEISSLKQRLEDRKVIEQAKWIIVNRKGMSEPDAMKALQRQARNNRRQLADVARSIIESERLLGDSGEESADQ